VYKNCSGDGKLSVGSKLGRSMSASPSATRRKQGEFLKVTESSPLVEPSEVLVVTRDVQFAQSVLSPYGTHKYILLTFTLFAW
jgi:hypothetical protein